MVIRLAQTSSTTFWHISPYRPYYKNHIQDSKGGLSIETLFREVTIQVPTLALVNEPQEDGQPLLVRGWLF
jgi:hypothetical protein